MSDLAAFLKARLDEDEKLARATIAEPSAHKLRWRDEQGIALHGPGVWVAETIGMGEVDGDDMHVYNEGGIDVAIAEHVARHDPARVLREVEAKRNIVTRMQEIVEDSINHSSLEQFEAEQVLTQLATVDADHPDYRPEWAPDYVRPRGRGE